MRKYLIFIAVLFLTISISSYCFADNLTDNEFKSISQKVITGSSMNAEFSGRLENRVRVVEVQAMRYKFVPDPIVVRLNEKVRLVVTSADVAHGFAIPEFNVNLSVPAGKTVNIEFVPDKKGTFLAYCSVYCGPGHGHMQAKFIVK